ncbi:MAG: hypothetical protein JW807_11580 [Spirochaetes bacterium]|nr:hypothetical protein [Spirochaetota bacterium]
MDPIQSTEFRKNLLIVIIAAAALSLAAAYATYRYYHANVENDLSMFLKSTSKIERGFIENFPLYEDYATPLMERKLRTYLFPAHMAAAAKYGIAPVDQEKGIAELVRSGRLINLESGADAPYYFYNVRKEFRVLTLEAAAGLRAVADRFYRNISLKAKLPRVKIAVSSALRPVSYQKGLRELNQNATIVSTHSYGISFDIFYDDYFVALPEPACSNRISKALLARLRTRMGFLLGDALRSQFRSVLMETLIQLQDEGALYAILESRQRCFHVTILHDGRQTPRPGE